MINKVNLLLNLIFNNMSLLEFLQQTLIKDVSYQLGKQIQSQHEAAENLLDNLASLRSFDKYQIIQSKIEQVKVYLNLKESIYRALTGLEGELFESWIQELFHDSVLMLELVKMQRTKIEKMIIKTLRDVFIVQMPTAHSEAQEQEKLNFYLLKLNKLKDNQLSKTKSTRQQVLQASRLDQIFFQYKQKMDEKIQRFNMIVQNYINQVKGYSQKIKLQFGNILGKEDQQKQTYNQQTPMKQINLNLNQNRHQYQFDNERQKYDEYLNSAKLSRNSYKYEYQKYRNPQSTHYQTRRWGQAPTRDIFSFETI